VPNTLSRFAVVSNYPQCFQWYSWSQIGKYISGSIWQFLERAALYREHGLIVKPEMLWLLATAVPMRTLRSCKCSCTRSKIRAPNCCDSCECGT
jgi:hypothetical protein